MINVGEGVALVMVGVVTVVSLLLVLATIVRKIRRDRRTQVSRDRHRALTLAMDKYRAQPSEQLEHELSHNLLIELRSTTGRRSLMSYLPRCDSAEIDLLGSLASQSGGCDVLMRAARSRRGPKRGSGILLLGLLRRPQVADLATAALSDRDSDVRLVGVRVLSLLPPSVGVPPLLSALRADTIPAARVVERLADTGASDELIAALEDRLTPAPDGQIPQHRADQRLGSGVANALWLIGDPAAEGVLMRLLSAGSPEERIAAARALGSCAVSGGITELEAALRDDDPRIRMQAATALGRLNATSSIDALSVALTDRSWWVRSNAASALSSLGEPGLQALRNVRDGSDRFAAERAREELMYLGADE